MNCPNCGASLRPIPKHNYLVCQFCGTFHLAAQSAEGVRVLGDPSQWRCPACRTRLTGAVIDDTPVLYCEGCRGFLVKGPDFRDLVAALRAKERAPATLPAPLDKDALRRVVNCPNCAGRMDTHPYYGPGNAVIDSCGACALIWLDHGELTNIVKAPGRDRPVW